jgi:hypothetical protein
MNYEIHKYQYTDGAISSVARHSALDAESPEKRSLIIGGLRVKPAMTIPYF